MRNLLYILARLLGDASAVKRGRIGARAQNRLLGRAVGQLLKGLWR